MGLSSSPSPPSLRGVKITTALQLLLCLTSSYHYSSAFVVIPYASPSLSQQGSLLEKNHQRIHPKLHMSTSSSNNNNSNPNNSKNEEKDNSNKKSNQEISSSSDQETAPNDSSKTTEFTKPPELKLSEEEFKRAVLKAKAQAEIDAILADADAPFDLSTELQKISPNGGISPGIPYEQLEEINLESTVHTIESSIYEASDKGDYTTAQLKKEELDKIHIDDCGYVLQANSKFYKAFSEKDYLAMEELWLHDASVLCIHPSHAPLVGAVNVLNTWKKMFESGHDTFQRNRMEPTNIRISVKGTTAIVTCDEDIYTRRFVRGRQRLDNTTNGSGSSTGSVSSSIRKGGKKKKESSLTSSSPPSIAEKGGMELVNKLIATNIFRKVGGKWQMVHHHSTWHADSDAAKNALNVQMGPSSSSSLLGGAGRGFGQSSRPSPQSSSSMMDISAEGVLGIPGHEGFGGEKKKQSDPMAGGGEGGPVKRVFTGSLSDFLNGGLSDILGGSGGMDGGLGGQGGDDVEETIIFSSDDEEDDDDDEIEEEAIVISNINPIRGDGSDGGLGPGIVLNGSSGDSSSSSSINNHLGGGKDKSRSGKNGGVDESSKDSLRQSCISALRNLAAQGAVSQKQKRMLLTDIIMSSAKGEYSMVEVAYDLLCSEGDDKDAAEEEFADQCRYFASTLPEHPPSRSQ